MLQTKLFPRILKFWALHLFMAGVGFLFMAVSGFFGLELIAGVLVTVLYFIVFARAAKEMLHSLKEGLIFGLIGALPLALTILGAVIYLQKVPYNTIGYSFILLPVMIPFMGWIEYVFPRLPYHILSISVPAVFAGAIIAGSLMREGGVKHHPR